MTTTLHSRITSRTINLSAACDGVRLDPQYGLGDITVDRAEFLAAIEAELGVLIINRDGYAVERDGEQYAVTEKESGKRWVRPLNFWTNPGQVGFSKATIAAADHFAANPPVDEAQVNALADLIIEADGTSSVTQKIAIRDVARRLVRAGVRAPEEAGR